VEIHHRRQLFHMQKKIIRITTGTKRKVSHRDMIRTFNLLPFASEYLLSIVTCEHGENSYNVGRIHRCDLQVPHTNFNKHQKQFPGTILFSNYTGTEQCLLSHSYSKQESAPVKKFPLIIKHVCKNDKLSVI
jgi:hypothetical protein